MKPALTDPRAQLLPSLREKPCALAEERVRLVSVMDRANSEAVTCSQVESVWRALQTTARGGGINVNYMHQHLHALAAACHEEEESAPSTASSDDSGMVGQGIAHMHACMHAGRMDCQQVATAYQKYALAVFRVRGV